MAYEIGWFSTGRDEAARDLFQAVWDRVEDGTIGARIAFVFSNREPGEDPESDRFFKLVAGYGVDLVCFSSRTFKPELRKRGLEESKGLGADSETLKQWRRRYDREVMGLLAPYHPDLSVLAGYMLVVSELMCERYNMINLHPAAPGGPKGTWQGVIWELISRRADHTGVMMHLVTEVLDGGPPVTFCTFPIRGGSFDGLWKGMESKLKVKPLNRIKEEEGEQEPLFREIRRQGVIRELPLLVQTVQVFADGQVRIADGRVISGGRVLEGGYDLTEEIEKIVRSGQRRR